MVVTSIDYVRRAVYELFLLSHMLFPVVVVFIMLHVAGSWPGFIPGLALHAADLGVKIVMWIRSKKGKVQHYGRITRLDVDLLHKPSLKGGEYYFVNIPLLSPLEWHPISASGVSENTVSFHIQAQAPGSWTDKFSVISSPSIIVNLDGPYGGIPLNLQSYACIVIIAGGIGITPFLILIEKLLTQTSTDNDKLRHIILHWTLKYPALYSVFRAKLAELQIKQSAIVLEVKVYYTGAGEFSHCGVSTSSGRLDIAETINSIHECPLSLCCLLCGPENLVSEGARCLNSRGIDFHSEVFLF